MAGMASMDHMQMAPAAQPANRLPTRPGKAGPVRTPKAKAAPAAVSAASTKSGSRRIEKRAASPGDHGMGDMPGMVMDHGAHTGAAPKAAGMDHAMHGGGGSLMGGMAGMNHAGHAAASPGMSGMDHSAHGAAQPGMAGMGSMGGMHMGHGGMGGGDALASSSPAQGAVMTGSPAQLSLVFRTPMRLESLQLFDSTGSRVPLAPAQAGGAQVSASLPSLPPDAYEARWRASDASGSTLTGILRFRVS